jgi:hypothetical protein
MFCAYNPMNMFVKYVRFVVSTAETMRNVVFWDVTSCGSC